MSTVRRDLNKMADPVVSGVAAQALDSFPGSGKTGDEKKPLPKSSSIDATQNQSSEQKTNQVADDIITKGKDSGSYTKSGSFEAKKEHISKKFTPTQLVINAEKRLKEIGAIGKEKDFEEVLKLFEEAEELDKQSNGNELRHTYKVDCYYGIVICFNKLKRDSQDILSYCDKFIEAAAHDDRKEVEMARNYREIGKILIDLEDYPSAKNCLEKSKKILQENPKINQKDLKETNAAIEILKKKWK